MSKIDLIIDALELAIKETQHPSLCIDKFDEALAAARELKDNYMCLKKLTNPVDDTDIDFFVEDKP